MVVPLRARGRTNGVVSLVAVSATREFGPDELALAEDLARRAALALDNARLYEHQRAVAATLQESLVPERLPDLRGIELGARFRPAGDGAEIGGDFFDVVRLGEAAATVTVGDVAGKGARAAALTGLTRHTLRTAATYESEPRAVLAALNRALLDQRGVRGKYCTVAMCRVERDATGADVRMACAGHPLPLVLRAGGEVVRVGRPGMLLGYVAEPDIAETRLRLAPGDALVLYTDGVTAATPTGDEGATRLATLLADVRGSDADAIAHRLEGAAVRDQGGHTSDDIAVAVVRIV
jgi:serine phosphatase RsbU (regulator of sigma subunit)